MKKQNKHWQGQKKKQIKQITHNIIDGPVKILPRVLPNPSLMIFGVHTDDDDDDDDDAEDDDDDDDDDAIEKCLPEADLFFTGSPNQSHSWDHRVLAVPQPLWQDKHRLLNQWNQVDYDSWQSMPTHSWCIWDWPG